MGVKNQGSIEVASGVLTDKLNGQQYPYGVFHGWSYKRAALCNANWGPYIATILINIVSKGGTDEEIRDAIANHFLQDHHWDWLQKAAAFDTDEYEWLFCEVEGIPQGACLFYHPKPSVLQSGNVFYIEYVSVAPWNRSIPGYPKRFDGIGKILIKAAIDLAMNQLKLLPGFNLHSLPQSYTYYEKIGMLKIDGHEKQGMNFYEMPNKTSVEFCYGTR